MDLCGLSAWQFIIVAQCAVYLSAHFQHSSTVIWFIFSACSKPRVNKPVTKIPVIIFIVDQRKVIFRNFHIKISNNLFYFDDGMKPLPLFLLPTSPICSEIPPKKVICWFQLQPFRNLSLYYLIGHLIL